MYGNRSDTKKKFTYHTKEGTAYIFIYPTSIHGQFSFSFSFFCYYADEKYIFLFSKTWKMLYNSVFCKLIFFRGLFVLIKIWMSEKMKMHFQSQSEFFFEKNSKFCRKLSRKKKLKLTNKLQKWRWWNIHHIKSFMNYLLSWVLKHSNSLL